MDNASLMGCLDEQLRNTGRFVPAAFHVHSVGSHDWGDRPEADSQRNKRDNFEGPDGIAKFLDELSTHFRIVCVTDHMKCGYACEVSDASLRRNDILVLPAMEVSCSIKPFADAVHLLLVFPPQTVPAVFEKLFSVHPKFPVEAQREGNERINIPDLGKWIREVEQEGGLVLLAHMDGDAGHRQVIRAALEDNLLSFVIDRDRVTSDERRKVSETYAAVLATARPHAVEIMNPEDKIHYVSYEHSGGLKCRMACVVRSDFHCLEQLGDTDCHTFLKVSRLDFASVHNALRFFETRVRFYHDLPKPSYPRILGLYLASPTGQGLFDEATMAFNENLNCLIGPRGSGKSTAVEAMRYVLGANADFADRDEWATDQPAKIAQQIQEANLGQTLIKLVYQTDEDQHYILSTTYDSRNQVPRVEVVSKDGTILPVDFSALPSRFPCRIYSWSQIESLGRRPESQRSLVDRLIPDVRDVIAKKMNLYQSLEANRADIASVVTRMSNKLQEQNGLARRYCEYKAEFEAINTTEVAALFSGLDEARTREAALQEAIDTVSELSNALNDVSADGIALFIPSSDDPSLREWWREQIEPQLKLGELGALLNSDLDAIRTRLTTKVAELQALAEVQRTAIGEHESEIRKQTQVSAEEEISRDRREQARDRYSQASRLRLEYLELYEQFGKLLGERETVLSEIETTQGVISEKRATCKQALLQKLAELPDVSLDIDISLLAGGDRQKVADSLENQFLRREFAGQYKNTDYAGRLCRMASPIGIGRALLKSDRSLLEAEGITCGQQGALSAAEAADLLNHFCSIKSDEGLDASVVESDKLQAALTIQQLPWDDMVSILLDKEPVDKKSPGQRSSAMLPLVALSEAMPLIIDQPEDNLDNRLVGHVLTQVFARLKEARQIIVATHSPNIVVGGDAEQVVVLEGEGVNKARLSATGSIDEPNIVKAIIDIMEGGKDAFEARERRYKEHLSK